MRQVADFQQVSLGFLRPVQAKSDGASTARYLPDLDRCVLVVYGQHEAGDVTPLVDRMPPVLVFVAIELAEVVAQNIGQSAAPAVAAIVAVQPSRMVWFAARCIAMFSVV